MIFVSVSWIFLVLDVLLAVFCSRIRRTLIYIYPYIYVHRYICVRMDGWMDGWTQNSFLPGLGLQVNPDSSTRSSHVRDVGCCRFSREFVHFGGYTGPSSDVLAKRSTLNPRPTLSSRFWQQAEVYSRTLTRIP